MGYFTMLTVASTMAHGLMTKCMVKESKNLQMAKAREGFGKKARELHGFEDNRDNTLC